MTTVAMLFASNVFMTLAWYGHLRYNEAAAFGLVIAAVVVANLPS